MDKPEGEEVVVFNFTAERTASLGRAHQPPPPTALIRKLGVLDPKQLEAVDEALRRWFGLVR